MQEYSLASRQEGRREPLHVYYVSREREARIAGLLSSWEEGRNGKEPLLTEALYSLHPKEALTVEDIQIIYCKMTTHFCSLIHHLSPQNLRQRVGARVTSQNVSHGSPRKSASGIWYQWDAIALIRHQFTNGFLAPELTITPKMQIFLSAIVKRFPLEKCQLFKFFICSIQIF